MAVEIREYTKERIPDVVRFEKELREQEADWGWEINEEYLQKVRASFEDPSFRDSISLLACEGDRVVGRIDCSMIKSHFDGSVKAYLDWICVLKDSRHRGAAQALLQELRRRLQARQVDTLIALTAANEEAQRFYRSVPRSLMRDTGIWIDVP